jgi:hypothetical protein
MARSSSQVVTVIAATAALVGAVGCQKWVPATRDVEARADIRVTYAEPRDVWGKRRGTDSTRIPGVLDLQGSVERAAPDTLHVSVISARGASGSRLAVERGAIVAVARDAGVNVSEHVNDAPRTLSLVALFVGLVAVAVSAAGQITTGGSSY